MNQTKSLELKIPPPIIFLVFAGIIWLISTVLPFAGIAFPGKNMIAMGMAAAGGLFGGLSILSFLRAKTTLHPEDPCKTTKLVVTGVYSITRNPMYLSLLFVLIAWATYLSNFAAFVPIPFFVAYLNRFQIRPEEKALISLFGSEFEDYRKHVRRWL
jgi:protein-S-isoprenylcysteine O-methyltransferase Ste14